MPTTEPMIDELPTEWARIKSLMDKAQEQVLKDNGYTWSTYGDLRKNVEQFMEDKDTVETEFGTIEAVKKPVWIHRESKQVGFQTLYIRLKEAK